MTREEANAEELRRRRDFHEAMSSEVFAADKWDFDDWWLKYCLWKLAMEQAAQRNKRRWFEWPEFR